MSERSMTGSRGRWIGVFELDPSWGVGGGTRGSRRRHIVHFGFIIVSLEYPLVALSI